MGMSVLHVIYIVRELLEQEISGDTEQTIPPKSSEDECGEHL
jgi:hypothetical protein